MRWTFHWQKEDGPRLEGARALDRLKVLTPCVVRNPAGGFRMFYTGLGPGKPFATCQGYILSATSRDGLRFQVKPGIRLAPQPELEHMSLRALAPSVAPRKRGGWRMYFEARGPADQPSVICSAVSQDMLRWELEEGIRLWTPGGVRAPRYLQLPDGRGRMYLCGSEYAPGGPATGKRLSQGVLSAISHDGVDFEFEPEYRLRSGARTHDSSGFSAAEVVAPSENAGDNGHTWTMFYSAWQNPPTGADVPLHPSQDAQAVKSGTSADFAAASIASDMAGYRSRIYLAHSSDGLAWERGACAIEGAGYNGAGPDAVHAEDMSLVALDNGGYRMYYAACDRNGIWRIASAASTPSILPPL